VRILRFVMLKVTNVFSAINFTYVDRVVLNEVCFKRDVFHTVAKELGIVITKLFKILLTKWVA
jgi:energy-converting hydrogenase A subunit M